MNGHPGSFADLDRILIHARHLLFDFDGPICSLFAETPTEPVASRLRKLITSANVQLPPHIETAHDWFEILAYAYSVNPGLATQVADELTEIESAAAATARPTAYAPDVVTACRESGRGVAIISNNSERAIRSYLNAHDLARQITIVAARTGPDPSKLKPSPYLIHQAAEALAAAPDECVMIGDSVTDIHAARNSRALAVGYARTSADAERLTTAGAQAIVASMANLALRLRAHPLTN